MAEQKNVWEVSASVCKDGMAVIRELIIFAFLLIIFISPETVKDKLNKAGIKKIGDVVEIADIERSVESTKIVGGAISRADTKYNELVAEIELLKNSAALSNAVKLQVQAILQEAKGTQNELTTARKDVIESIKTQQAIVSKIAPSTTPMQGWVYLGKVSKDGMKWAGDDCTISNETPQIPANAKVRFITDVYMRNPSSPDALERYSMTPIVGVVGKREEVTVLKTFTRRSNSEGFLWAKIRRDNV